MASIVCYRPAMSPHRHDRIVVGIPVHNEERFVVDCIRSMQVQTAGDFLCLISDNASTDGTEAACRAAIAGDHRFVYVRQPVNIGSSPNINFLRSQSESPYFAWIGSHDRVQPRFLERHLGLLDANPAYAVSYTYWEWIDADGRVVGREPIKGLGELWGGRWSRYLWSIESAEVGGLQGVMRREILPERLMRSCPGCDHVLLSTLVFKSRFHVFPERLYQARRFVEADRPADYMERITGRSGGRRDLSELVTAYMEEFENLPAPAHEKDRWRGLAHWLIRDKFAPDSRRWHRKFGVTATVRRMRALRRWLRPAGPV
jgi:glycosyltransferase involved in cell wall biosynthesis